MSDETSSTSEVQLFQRAKFKSLMKKIGLVIMIFAVFYSSIAILYKNQTLYKVRHNYAIILETMSGERVAITDVGWHTRAPLFTRIELEVPLMNQEVHLGGSAEQQRIMSKGNVSLLASAMMTYRIHDINQWGIENRSPATLLQNDFDGIVKDVMQSQTINSLVSERELIKEEIYTTLKERPINTGGLNLEEKYGITVVSFVLRDTNYGEKLAAASEEKKRRELIAEADNYAADLEASRIRKLYTAYQDSIRNMRKALDLSAENDAQLFQFLTQQKWATAYEKNQRGQNTFVLNNSQSSSPNLTLPASSEVKEFTETSLLTTER